MKQLRSAIIRAGLETLAVTGTYRLLQPVCGGVGLILMLHHVRPARDASFQPNRHLEITPDFLHAALKHLRASGVDLVTMDEVHSRLAAKNFGRRFAAFTFDDGYRDNRDHALPIMREFGAPLTVYATTQFAEGTGRLWWLTLEAIIARTDTIDIVIDGCAIRAGTATPAEKQAVFLRIHDVLRGLPSDAEVRSAIDTLAARYDVDPTAFARDLCMSWDELKSFAADPLVTIGAHTVSHCNLAHESGDLARVQIRESKEHIAHLLGQPVRHFAYPYGDKDAAGVREFNIARELGYASAVTTRPGVLFPEHADHMTALPRVSLNGNYQNERFLSVLASGAATALANGFRRVDAA